MLAVIEKEFLSLLRSFKSITVVGIFLLIAYSSGSYLHNHPEIAAALTSKAKYLNGAYNIVLDLFVLLFGYLFVLMLSHDILNNEIESQVMRFVVTKTSRIQVVMGKYIGILLFWLTCLLLSYGIISYFAGDFLLNSILRSFAIFVHGAGLAMLLSLAVKRTGHSAFYGLILGLAMPTIGLLGMTADPNIGIQALNFLLPYYYLDPERGAYLFLAPFWMSFLMVSTAAVWFRWRDI